MAQPRVFEPFVSAGVHFLGSPDEAPVLGRAARPKEYADQKHVVPYSFHPVKLLPPPRPNRKTYPFVNCIEFQGLKIGVETAKGQDRTGTDPNGKPWRVTMSAHYGEFLDPAPMGVDGDALDVFVGPNADSPLVVIIHQRDPDTRQYDEDKVMLGFDRVQAAIYIYRSHYNRVGYYGSHTVLHIGEFRRWVHNKKRSGKPMVRKDGPMATNGEIAKGGVDLASVEAPGLHPEGTLIPAVDRADGGVPGGPANRYAKDIDINTMGLVDCRRILRNVESRLRRITQSGGDPARVEHLVRQRAALVSRLDILKAQGIGSLDHPLDGGYRITFGTMAKASVQPACIVRGNSKPPGDKWQAVGDGTKAQVKAIGGALVVWFAGA